MLGKLKSGAACPTSGAVCVSAPSRPLTAITLRNTPRNLFFMAEHQHPFTPPPQFLACRAVVPQPPGEGAPTSSVRGFAAKDFTRPRARRFANHLGRYAPL